MRPPVPPPPPPWRSKLTSVGVTGTNGKTSTTAWVAAALGVRQAPVARATTVGSFLGDEPIDVERNLSGFFKLMATCLERGGRYAAVEATSEALAMGFSVSWPSDVAVFTNLTHDHLDAHKNAEHYLASKAQLFLNLRPNGCAVLNGCDDTAPLLARVLRPDVKKWFYGVSSRGDAKVQLDLEAVRVETTWSGTTVHVKASEALRALGEFPSEIRTPAIGEVYAENVLAAWLGAVAAGVSPSDAKKGIESAKAPPGRFQVVHDSPHVVVDYAHTPDAIERTLRSARALTKGTLTIVFGAGGKRDKDKRPFMGKAASLADRIVLTNDNPRDESPSEIASAVASGIEPGVPMQVELDRVKAIHLALRDAKVGDVIVIAGRGHESEQIFGTTRVPMSDVQIAREFFLADDRSL